jgi:hypothetical protein
MDATERDLALQLALARKNSKNQHGKPFNHVPLQNPSEATIYEGMLPTYFIRSCTKFFNIDDPPRRPLSRTSRDTNSRSSATPRSDSNSNPPIASPPRQSRSLSQHSSERRPLGPRSPSPLPPAKSLHAEASTPELPSMDDDLALENAVRIQRSAPVRATGIPRSKRQPFFPAGNIDATPKPPVTSAPTPSGVEPLSIKKKTSVRATEPSSTTEVSRKPPSRGSPLSRARTVGSPRRVSPQVRSTRASSMRSPSKNEPPQRLIQLSKMTKEDVGVDFFPKRNIADKFPGRVVSPSH